jgi:crossover junction endodeoxyribonuclease RusA
VTNFVVPGPPIPKARPRMALSGHVFTPKRTRDYERAVALCACGAGLRTPLDGAVSVTLRLFLANRRRCDIDNLTKSVLDGLNGIAYADDSQVQILHVSRNIDAANPRAEIEITTVKGV